MATVSGVLKDANVNGKPRDLADIIYDISPTDTPFLTMCGKTVATQTLHEWQTDALAAPATNAQLEGADSTTYAESNTTECSNRTQILKKAISVSGTVQAIKHAGVDKEYNYQMARALKEIKKDLEYALLSNQIEAPESGSNGRKMRGLPAWLKTNTSLGSSGAVATTSAAATAGTARAFTEAMLQTVLLGCYTQGGNPDTIMVAPALKQKLSATLNGGATRMEKVEAKKAHAVVDVYVSDFGSLDIVPNRVQAGVGYSQKCAFVLDPEYWKVAMLRDFNEDKLATIGDSVRGHVIVEATLEARNEASSGMVADLNA